MPARRQPCRGFGPKRSQKEFDREANMTTNPSVPSPADLISGNRCVLAQAQYLVLPKVNRCAIGLPPFTAAKMGVLATPRIGAQFVASEIMFQSGGGTARPIEAELEHFLYVLEGELRLTTDAEVHPLAPGSYAWLPPRQAFELACDGSGGRLFWFERRYTPAEGYTLPALTLGNEQGVPARREGDIVEEQRFLPRDPAFDVAFNVIHCDAGGYYGLVECHAWEHAMYMLEGEGVLWLNGAPHPVKQDDFVYIGPYCPEFFSAQGLQGQRARFLLYWDAHRHYDREL
jgi:(S)-ureidoglycine aminohydrolase